VFEQWLRCCYLFLHGLPETHHEDRKRKAIRLAVHENTFTLPSSNSFLELKFLITLFFFILLFVLCQSFLLYVASSTPINFFLDVLLTVHLSIFISVINQLDAQHFCFTISLFHAFTCFEHMCSLSGSQNCITQPLVSSHL